jgi:phosphatidylglycerophosphate synthase
MNVTYLLDEGGAFKTANLVSLLRGVLIPPIIVLLMRHMNAAAMALYVLAVATDGLDGWLARQSGRCSEFGAVLDSVVDNIFSLFIAIFLWLALPGLYADYGLALAVLFMAPIAYLAVSWAMTGHIIMFHFHSARLGALALFALWPAMALTGAAWLVPVAALLISASRIEQILFMARGGRDPDARHMWEGVGPATTEGRRP